MPDHEPLRLLFAGTPEFAATHLDALIASGHRLLAVYTQPDRPAGRGRRPQASAVGELAAAHGLPVLKPQRLDAEACAGMLAFEADLLIVVAYGLILPRAALDAARLGALNVHASLLPRWRGAAPIQRAIEAGDRETGVCIMQMDEGLDTGDIRCSARLVIGPQTTAGELHDALARLGRNTLLECLQGFAAGTPPPAQPQPATGASYARKLTKTESAIDWSLPAEVIARKVRAFNPWPVCSARCDDAVLRIWQARSRDDVGGDPGAILATGNDQLLVACGEGGLQILEAQWPGGRKLPIAELLKSKACRLQAAGRLQ